MPKKKTLCFTTANKAASLRLVWGLRGKKEEEGECMKREESSPWLGFSRRKYSGVGKKSTLSTSAFFVLKSNLHHKNTKINEGKNIKVYIFKCTEPHM